MRTFVLAVVTVFGFMQTSYALESLPAEYTFSKGEIVRVDYLNCAGLNGYSEFSRTPNGAAALTVVLNGTYLRILNTEITTLLTTKTVWLQVERLDDAGTQAPLWIIGGTISPGSEGSGLSYAYVARVPDMNSPLTH